VTPSIERAREVVAALVAGGVRHVVLCPGSRSAPIAYVVEAADRAGLLTLHVRVDERSAGFLALGLAKRTRVPAAVVTTSGTAVANLHPAVLEAHHARVPMIVLSADRPAELRGTGANQTTTQPGMFGVAVAHEVDLSPEESWRAPLDHAVLEATRQAQPVHLNLQLREPLVPTEAELGELLDGTRPGGAPRVRTPVVQHAAPAPGPGATRPLVVVGDLPDPADADPVLAWAAEHGVPVVAEPFGPHPRAVVPAGSLLVSDTGWVAAHEPDLVLVVGRPTLARPVAALLRRAERLVAIESGLEFGVPGREVTRIDADRLRTLDLRVADDWTPAWSERGAAVAAAVAGHDLAWPSSLAVARVVAGALPSGARLFLGSSNAVRDVDLAGAFATDEVDVVASRGLAGIDGCVSTSVGLALAEPQRPTYALLGDLTFLHDTNGLLIGSAEPRPDLTIVVANDDGGGIFTLLEPGAPEHAAPFDRLFGTPTGARLADLCAAHGIRHSLATSPEVLGAAVARPPEGIAVVEVTIDRTTHRAAHDALRRLARDA
jgi:2-succinyl-5-enolpyruvyl-6-hydroxy-3-cyclohexene-1-carboxylate synthase